MQKNHFFLGGFRKKCHICIRNLKGGIAQLARAPALQAGGRRFDSDYLHKKDLINRSGLFHLYAQHGHVLTGESPQCALMTGSI